MPDIDIYNSTDTHFKGMNIKQANDFVLDEFDDELFLVIKKHKKINIVTACSHRWITNICSTAAGHFKLPVSLILGGFHMKECSVEQYEHITHYFQVLRPKSIGACHCTGIEKFAELKGDCEMNLFYNFTGHEVTI